MDDPEAKDRVFNIARRMVDLRQDMWVSDKQFLAYATSGLFSEPELKFFKVVHPWPGPDEAFDDG